MRAANIEPYWSPWTKNPRKKLRGFCAVALVVSREKIQYLVVVLRFDLDANRSGRYAKEFPAKSSFLLYNLSGLAHNRCFRDAKRKDRTFSDAAWDVARDRWGIFPARGRVRGPGATAAGRTQRPKRAFRTATGWQRRSRGPRENGGACHDGQSTVARRSQFLGPRERLVVRRGWRG